MTILAIPTRYAGYRFRSRLEARWAVFFDALKIDWTYEPEGYMLPDGSRYLPDFFLRMTLAQPARKRFPGAGYLVEVKPIEPSIVEVDKLRLASEGTKHRAYFLQGVPGSVSPIYVHAPTVRTPEQIAAQLQFDQMLPTPERSEMEKTYSSFLSGCSDNFTPQTLTDAVIAARSERFS